MEHRWGARSKLEVPVQIDCGSGAVVFGMIRDASVSGAFVCTAARMPAMTIVSVAAITSGRQARECVDAYVVRWTPEGCGLEWCDLAPQAILDLLNLSETQPVLAATEPSPREVIVDPPEIRRSVAQEDIAL